MRRICKISPFTAGPALLLVLGGLSACAPSAPRASVGTAAAARVPTGTVVAVRHADPGQSGAALGQIMSILGQPMPANAGPGTEVVIKMQNGSVKSVAEPVDPPLSAGQTVTVTKTPDGVSINPI
ncbi:MAG: hypothetical protein ACLPJJ_09600 [Acidocella sp.]|uniref:hypothetical protein n=1 Tax=Acidocella sp. TaxID=50710 RepID=UPI003FD7C846